MGCIQTKREILRSNSGKIYNRKIKRQKKFRTGLHVEKTSEMGAEANFQAAYTVDTDEVYTRSEPKVTKVNGSSSGGNGKNNNIPKVLDVVRNNLDPRETQVSQSAPE